MDQCREWSGSRDHRGGYGQLYREGRTLKAHRVTYEECIGPIPAGMCVLHKCDNPPCVNPSHLFLGTNEDNVRDRVAKRRTINGNTVKTHCVRGHEFTGSNTMRPPSGGRQCKECHRIRQNERYHASGA